MSFEDAINTHAAALEKLAAAIELKAKADMKQAEIAEGIAAKGLKMTADTGAKEVNAELQGLVKAVREQLASVAAPAPKPAETIAPEDLPSTGAEVSDAAPEKPAVTYEDLRKLCVSKAGEKGRDYVLGVLAEFGAHKPSDVPEDQLRACYDAMTAGA